MHTDVESLNKYAHDETEDLHFLPAVVLIPKTVEEISRTMIYCYENDIPVTPAGARTGLSGGSLPVYGGVLLSTEKLNKIIEIDEKNHQVITEPGVITQVLQETVKGKGLFYPPDPASRGSCFIGGNVSENSGGPKAVKYGVTQDYVLNLEVVLPNGAVIWTGANVLKNATGYNLTQLMVGSEGTLGVITEITLKLHGEPESISAAVCQFDNIEDAVNVVINSFASGVPLARIELLDDLQMEACINFSQLNEFKSLPTLFFEFHGSKDGVLEQTNIIQEISSEFGGHNFDWKNIPEERNRLWQARHNAYYAAIASKPGCEAWSSDVCVPITDLASFIIETKKELESLRLNAPLVGHVGDGNFHLLYLVDPENQDEIKKAKDHNDKMVQKAIKLGGTCTGEHGIGYGKASSLALEAGSSINIMKSIKTALDPNGILNPGKIFL